MTGAGQTGIAGSCSGDTLSTVLRQLRLNGSLQFCMEASGEWQTDDRPAFAGLRRSGFDPIPFHIVSEGTCWLEFGTEERTLTAGDVVVFPFGSGHRIGVGRGGPTLQPSAGLSGPSLGGVPRVRYGQGDTVDVRLLCGYMRCDGLSFGALRASLPELLHVGEGGWAATAVQQILREAESGGHGAVAIIERLTETVFIEMIRSHMAQAIQEERRGLLTAMSDPALSRCLGAIHDDPLRQWRLRDLAAIARLSPDALADRFVALMGTTPKRYIQDWRLEIGRSRLQTTQARIAEIAYDSGYASEASFTRAFSRRFGLPPAAWRRAGAIEVAPA